MNEKPTACESDDAQPQDAESKDPETEAPGIKTEEAVIHADD